MNMREYLIHTTCGREVTISYVPYYSCSYCKCLVHHYHVSLKKEETLN